jgi:hypothetical protein
MLVWEYGHECFCKIGKKGNKMADALFGRYDYWLLIDYKGECYGAFGYEQRGYHGEIIKDLGLITNKEAKGFLENYSINIYNPDRHAILVSDVNRMLFANLISTMKGGDFLNSVYILHPDDINALKGIVWEEGEYYNDRTIGNNFIAVYKGEDVSSVEYIMKNESKIDFEKSDAYEGRLGYLPEDFLSVGIYRKRS